MKSKSILIISFTNLKSDPRVLRQITNFNNTGYKIFALGLSDPEVKGVTFIKVSKREYFLRKVIQGILLLFKFHEIYYWNLKVVKQSIEKTRNLHPDLIVANDIDSLPLAAKLKLIWNCKLIFDAHEYSPKEHEDKFVWRLLFQKFNIYMLKKHLCHADKMITVCDGIAQEYYKNFGILPEIINNATEYFELKPKILVTENIRIIHHGASIISRKIENMIYLMDYLDKRFSLDLMLVPSHGRYHKKLLKLIEKRPNVHIIKPVPMKEIVPFISNYDIGLYILEPTNLNNGMALPNKIFEFIQARLAIAIGPSPEMKALTEKFNIGIVSDDFSPKSLAVKLNVLDNNQINSFKENSNIAAQKINSEINIKNMIQTVDDLLKES